MNDCKKGLKMDFKKGLKNINTLSDGSPLAKRAGPVKNGALHTSDEWPDERRVSIADKVVRIFFFNFRLYSYFVFQFYKFYHYNRSLTRLNLSLKFQLDLLLCNTLFISLPACESLIKIGLNVRFFS